MDNAIPSLMPASLLGGFNQRDQAQRITAIAGTYAEDVVFSDPEGVVTGREALNEKAQHVLDGAPGLVFRPTGPVRHVGNLGLLSWHLGPDNQPPVVSGTDIAIVNEGRITALYTLLDD